MNINFRLNIHFIKRYSFFKWDNFKLNQKKIFHTLAQMNFDSEDIKHNNAMANKSYNFASSLIQVTVLLLISRFDNPHFNVEIFKSERSLTIFLHKPST